MNRHSRHFAIARRGWAASLFLLLALGLCPGASAQVFERLESAFDALEEEFLSLWPEDMRDDLELRLGAGAGLVPDYAGSDNYRLRFVPLIDLSYKDVVRLSGTKVSVNAYRNGGFRVRPFLNLHNGRGEGRNKALEGLGGIGNAFQLGLALEYQWKIMLATAEVRQGLSDGHGTVARLTLGSAVWQSENWRVGLALRADWGNDTHNRTFYGISPTQSSQSAIGLPVYTPSAGVNELSALLLVRGRLSEKWRLDVLSGYGQIVGSARRSPLVRDEGDAEQFQIGAGLRYLF